MAVFKLQYNGCIVGSFKTGYKLTNAINKNLKKNPGAKRCIRAWIEWY